MAFPSVKEMEEVKDQQNKISQDEANKMLLNAQSIDEMKKALELGADINAKDERGLTILMIRINELGAINRNTGKLFKEVKFLFSCDGIDINVVPNAKYSIYLNPPFLDIRSLYDSFYNTNRTLGTNNTLSNFTNIFNVFQLFLDRPDLNFNLKYADSGGSILLSTLRSGESAAFTHTNMASLLLANGANTDDIPNDLKNKFKDLFDSQLTLMQDNIIARIRNIQSNLHSDRISSMLAPDKIATANQTIDSIIANFQSIKESLDKDTLNSILISIKKLQYGLKSNALEILNALDNQTDLPIDISHIITELTLGKDVRLIEQLEGLNNILTEKKKMLQKSSESSLSGLEVSPVAGSPSIGLTPPRIESIRQEYTPMPSHSSDTKNLPTP